MILFLKKLLGSPGRKGEGNLRAAEAKAVLISEMARTQVDGKPVTHRRLESLMLAAGTGKRETIRLLREIGARPSSRHGTRIWTLR